MATINTLIDYDRQNPTAIAREEYEDVGADAFSPGTFPRAFRNLEVWDAAADGNQLILNTDYELVLADPELSGLNYEAQAVYKTLRVINATYQTGSIWLTYSAVGTYPTSDLHDPSSLPAAAALVGTEPIATLQSGVIVKATPAQIAAFVAGDATSLTAIAGASQLTDAFAPKTNYSTGWVANSDWTNAELTVTHNLTQNLSDLIVTFFVSSDGAEANAIDINYGHNGVSNGIGFAYYAIDTASFKIQTGSNGILYLDDNGVVQLLDSESWHYKVSVYYLGA